MRSLQSLPLGATALCFALAGCSGGGSGSLSSTGSISISLVDLPVDFLTQVNVEVAAIWLKPAGDGPAFQLPLTSTPITVDLLAHTGDDAALLVDGAAVPAGEYAWLAMDVHAAIDNVYDSYVVTETMEQHEVFVPSSRIRLVNGFEVVANEAVELVFDWNLREGLIAPPGLSGYLLKPAFRILEARERGVLAGEIPVDFVIDPANECDLDVADGGVAPNPADIGNVVYVYAGHGVTPDDLDIVEGDDAEPITTVAAKLNGEATHYGYRTTLEFGDYTVAFTCQGANDDPELRDADSPESPVRFIGGTANITVDMNALSSEVDFPRP